MCASCWWNRPAHTHKPEAQAKEDANSFACASGLCQGEPQRRISSCGTSSWSRTRATTKSTRSCTDLYAVIPAGHRRQDDRPGLSGPMHILDLRDRKGRLPRHQNQLAALFQMHIRRPLNQILAGRVGNAAERAPRARANDHPARQKRPAGDGGHEVIVAMASNAAPLLRQIRRQQLRQIGPPWLDRNSQLLLDHCRTRRTDHQMHVPPRPQQHLQQPRRIHRPARAGDGEDEWNSFRLLIFGRRAQSDYCGVRTSTFHAVQKLWKHSSDSGGLCDFIFGQSGAGDGSGFGRPDSRSNQRILF